MPCLSSAIQRRHADPVIGVHGVSRFMARTMLISIVSRKSLRLSGESRAKHSNGQLITHISADASFFDWAALLSQSVQPHFHWTLRPD
jgi:hypothetical protein